MKGLIASFFILTAALNACAAPSPARPFYKMSQEEISRTISNIHKKYPLLPERVAQVSRRFIGTPYQEGPLGEGPSGEFSQKPLMSFKAADCTTFVEETMALSLAKNLSEARTLLQKIRYKGGKISYPARNHFPSEDWIPNNIQAGFLKDITATIAGPHLKIASKVISKRKWYAGKIAGDIAVNDLSPSQEAALLKKLRKLGGEFPDQKVFLPYLPMRYIPRALSRIPSGTVANLVRGEGPEPVLVSHQVLIIDKNGQAYVRHAAFDKSVQDVLASDYFRRYSHSKWEFLGLNLVEITAPNKSRNK